jgi:hypothetical protein
MVAVSADHIRHACVIRASGGSIANSHTLADLISGAKLAFYPDAGHGLAGHRKCYDGLSSAYSPFATACSQVSYSKQSGYLRLYFRQRSGSSPII